MPDSTSALINQLANPPNPFETAGRAIQGMNALQQYKADQAAANAYANNTDAYGNVDLAGVNRDIARSGATWNFAKQMQLGGAGLQAQGAGAEADLNARIAQQSALTPYISDLALTASQGGQVTGQQLQDRLDQIPPSLLPETRREQMQQQITAMGPGPSEAAKGFAMGAAFGNQHAIETMKSRSPHYGTIDLPGGVLPYQANPMAPGGATFPTAIIPKGPTVGEALAQTNLLRSPVQGGWTEPEGSEHAGEHREGSLQQWYESHKLPIPPAIGTLRPGPGGTVTLPGLPGEPPLRVTPPAAPPGAPAGAPRRGGTAPQGPEPSGYIKPPGAPPAPAELAPTGVTVPSPRVVAAGEETYNAAQADMPASQDRAFRLRQAAAAMEGATTGRGTEGLQTLNSLMGTWAPDWVTKGLGVNPRVKAANYDEAAKYLQSIANAAFPGGSSTNDKLAAAVSANPNVHISDLGAKHIIQVMIAGEEMKQHVFKEAQAANIAPANYAKFAADWATKNDPRAFILEHMPGSKREALAKEINSGSASGKKLLQTIDDLVQKGAIKDPRVH